MHVGSQTWPWHIDVQVPVVVGRGYGVGVLVVWWWDVGGMLVRCPWDVGEGLYCDFIRVLYAFYKVFDLLERYLWGWFVLCCYCLCNIC